MPITNFPKGFADGISVRGIPLLSLYPGKVFWVSNATTLLAGQRGGSNGNKGTFDAPFETIDFAVGKCTALRGDIIVAKAGHAEAITAIAGLALDVAGIAIIFQGTGASRAKITFSTVTGADMNADAEGITLVNPRFVAGIDALTGPLDINAANFAMINALVEDAAGIAAIDWYVADANADDLLIDGWEYRVSTTGTQKQSNIQIAGATRPVLRGIRITGDFGTGPIENGTAWIDATLENVMIDNAATGPVVGTSSGQMRDVNIRVASGTTYLTANNDMQFFNCQGVGVDADGGEQIGAIIATSVEGKIDVIDAFHDIPSTDSTDDNQMSDVIGAKADTASIVEVTTDSLVSYMKGLMQQGTRTLVKATVNSIDTAVDVLFTITGGPIRVKSIIGVVIVDIEDTSCTLQIRAAVTTPSANVGLSTAVQIQNDDAGTMYTFVGGTGVLTPTSAGAVIIDMASATLREAGWVVPIGDIHMVGSADITGDITWVLTYYPNSIATVVVA